LKKEKAQLGQILARNTLGGPHYDEILARVLERTAAAEPPRSGHRVRRVAVWGAVLLPAAAALIIFAARRDPFTAKGTFVGHSGALDIGCAPEGTHTCRVGATLMFTVNAARVSGHLGAYAERTDDPLHARITYFPDATGATPVVAPRDGTIVVPEGVEIGPEHRPGHYRVTAWISSRPIDGRQLDAAGPDTVSSRATLDLEIVP